MTTESTNPAAILGKKGGMKTLENNGKKHYRKMALKSWEGCRKRKVDKSIPASVDSDLTASDSCATV